MAASLSINDNEIENTHYEYKPSVLTSIDCEDIYDDEKRGFNSDIMIKNNNPPETGEFENTEKFIYKLNKDNIKEGDYLYAVRTKEPDEIWVAYSPISKDGPGTRIDWGNEDEEFENTLHHSCLVQPGEKVYIAGELMIRTAHDEIYIYINCRSGHYQPDEKNLDILIFLLKKKFPDFKIMNWDQESCKSMLINRKLEDAKEIKNNIPKTLILNGSGKNKKRTNNKGTNNKTTSKKGTNNKGTNKKGTNKKRTNNKGTNNKGTNKKRTNNKGTNKKRTNNKGTNNKIRSKKGTNNKGTNKKRL